MATEVGTIESGEVKETSYTVVEVKKYDLIKSYFTKHADGSCSGGCECLGSFNTDSAAQAAKKVFELAHG